MKKVYIKTLGCRTNQFDSMAILSRLCEHGYRSVSCAGQADVIIVNTCTVTGRADTKSGQAVRKFAREFPAKDLVVAGCGPVWRPDLFKDIGNVKKVVGVNAAQEVLKFLNKKAQAKKEIFGTIRDFGNRTRPHIKIQEGCDAFCSYCIVPLVRGKPVSRPFKDVLQQARELVRKGYQEIVLTGIHTGKYRDGNRRLGDLVAHLARLKGNFRVRISSIEPNEVTEKIVDHVLHHPKVCNHLHISLQSGDDKVLSLMSRHYRAADFFRLADRIRAKDRYCGLGTDIIVGFNGEDRDSFKTTYKLVRESPLTYGHVFPFSLRKGTRAQEIPGSVNQDEKAERSRMMKGAFAGLKACFLKQTIGSVFNVIFETSHTGLTANYARVLNRANTEKGTMVPVKITGADREILTGRITWDY
jgi:threonylcarbamoyladenosine tRNA methylthiotransferase MtaB